MKLDNREKYEKLRKFIAQLKLKKNIDPFLDLDQIPKFGIYDFWYINKNPPSFTKIEKKIKDSKYDELDQFLEDIRQIFVSVSDYAFSEDPIQKICEQFKEEVDRFRQAFLDEFKQIIEPKIVKAPKPAPNPVKVKEKQPVAPPPRQAPPPVEDILFRERPSTLAEKLQMLFLLRANQNNEPYLRSIGTHYGIGMQIQDQYVLTINDKNKFWLQFIDKNQ